MEDENDGGEIVVTAPRLRESDASSGGGGDWGWVSFYSTSGGFGADSFDFGGGGGSGDIVVTAPEEEPAEEDTPPEDEIVVTAPEPPTDEALEAGVVLTDWAWDNVGGDFRVTLDGDAARLEFYDLLTGEHVVFSHSPIGSGWTGQPFDVDSFEHDPSFFQAPAYGTEHLDWL